MVWLAKVSDDGLSEACGSSSTPFPLKATACGDPAALSVTVRSPTRAPALVGVKVTEIVQLAPAATEEPHVLVCAKSPEAATCVIASAAVPVFESRTVWLVLATPTFWLAKVSVGWLSEA